MKAHESPKKTIPVLKSPEWVWKCEVLFSQLYKDPPWQLSVALLLQKYFSWPANSATLQILLEPVQDWRWKFGMFTHALNMASWCWQGRCNPCCCNRDSMMLCFFEIFVQAKHSFPRSLQANSHVCQTLQSGREIKGYHNIQRFVFDTKGWICKKRNKLHPLMNTELVSFNISILSAII